MGRLVTPFDFVLIGQQGYYFVYPPGKIRLKKLADFRNWITSRACETRSLV